MIEALTIDKVTRSYLASNQLAALQGKSKPHLTATVATTMSVESREFSWLWDGTANRAILANRLTGTLFDPESGQAINAVPRLLNAPIEVPEIVPGANLPAGVFSTAKE